ncbi:ribosomal protein S30 [Diplocarpon mali]|nr:ribosomal protein S30 [Diplocarpon mali]
MGKVHGSLARAGKVKSQTPKDLGDRGGDGGGNLNAMHDGALDRKRVVMRWLLGDEYLLTDHAQVEPQEKKKTPKGRAKKRITYTRRFVNVTLTGGKRKMNPNPTT